MLFELKDRGLFDNIIEYQEFYDIGGISGVASDFINNEVRNILFHIKGTLKVGFPNRHFCLLLRTVNDEYNFASIYILGIFSNISNSQVDYKNANKIIDEIKQVKRLHPEVTYFEAFTGVIEFDDSFRSDLKSKIVKIIKKALIAVEDIAAEELAVNENLINRREFTPKVIQQNTILIC